MKLKVYVVEDMGIARASILSALSRSGHQVMGSAASAESAWMEIQTLQPDLVLVDINLKGSKDGIWLGEKIKSHFETMVIFLTASSDTVHLSKIIAMDAEGYLMKPFNNPSLITMIEMAAIRWHKNNKVVLKDQQFSFVKTKTGLHKIVIPEILYFQSDTNDVHIHLSNVTYITRAKLTDMIPNLDLPDNFIRIHRRYIINKHQIKTIQTNSLMLSNEVEIPVSKGFIDDVNILVCS